MKVRLKLPSKYKEGKWEWNEWITEIMTPPILQSWAAAHLSLSVHSGNTWRSFETTDKSDKNLATENSHRELVAETWH